ncbi:MAG: hypothetical protein ACK4WJ_02080 [Endomicrobiia bacterium]
MERYPFFFLFIFIISISFCQDLSQKIEELGKKLPQAKITENVIYIKPDMQFYLPNGAVDIAFKEKYKRYLINFYSKYDFVDNFMGFNLDFGYEIQPFLGINLYDKVDFSEFFANQETIFRTQTVAPYTKINLSRVSSINLWLGFERTLMTSTETLIKFEQGNNVLGKIYFLYNTTKETNGGNGYENNNFNNKKKYFLLQLRNSIKSFGSDYDYANIELIFIYNFKILKEQFFEYTFKTGYPIFSNQKPLSEIYYLGGYQTLKGYRYKEFSAEAIIYNQLKYKIPIVKTTELNFLGITFSILTWHTFLEIAKFANKDIFNNNENFKYCVGSGLDYTFTILRILPIKINLTLAQAFENVSPQIHITISTTYYTWKKE